MKNFKLISEHYGNKEYGVMVGENNNKYEVRVAYEDPFTLLNTFEDYYKAVDYAEKEVGNR